jgi:hypothetical protein
MTRQESQQFIINWVNEHKYSVSWSGNSNGETNYYKTEEEARKDSNFSNFQNEFPHWQDAKTKEDYIYEVELRRLDKIAKVDYEKIISFLEDDDTKYATELLHDSHFNDAERIWAKASYISDDWDEENNHFKLTFQEKPFANYATRAFEEKEFVTL